ncbi:rhodanese-like domain-containing protein [Streptomyces sp. SID11385]|uniref:rhodanese-like domain-containing protein n=1 Tax=Streptomyces sp. SID11385 TaxID=2706031 RepID=UPI0013CBB8A6|nr:rhodanese-like domain-containing protein [Streptomyces sp. SID11385]NEA38640.1 rhodanese-like domain-containing protein [Streptomyces sp. SID11385]
MPLFRRTSRTPDAPRTPRASRASHTPRLTPPEAHTLTTPTPNSPRPESETVLLDVREKPEYRAVHAPGAVLAPLSSLAAGAQLPPNARDKKLVVICRSGHRSQQAVRLLAARGIEAVDVEGGMTAWAAAGLPVIRAS